MFYQNFSQTHIIFAPVAFFSTLNCINNYFFCCRYISPWCVYINMLAWGQLSFLDNCMHTSDPLREQSVELPVVQKVCESFLFTYCKDCWLIERVVSYVSPPHILVLGALASLSLSFNGGWKRKGSPRTKSTVPASLFFVKLPCVERRRFAALVADINSVMSLRSWLPNVFWWVCTFQAKGCKGEASGCPASHAFLAFAFQSPENKQKKKIGKACSAGEDFNENICFVHLGDQVELSRQYEHELRHWPYE